MINYAKRQSWTADWAKRYNNQWYIKRHNNQWKTILNDIKMKKSILNRFKKSFVITMYIEDGQNHLMHDPTVTQITH